LDQIESIQKRIDELDKEIKSRVASRKEDLRIAMSIPGIGFTAAVIILAESQAVKGNRKKGSRKKTEDEAEKRGMKLLSACSRQEYPFLLTIF
jgi:transposase